ncbi:MAG: phosphatase PAP2 family protein [Actinobacteria bacterium]|nr:phosphatase PAP2 family protein [Actinomycetota bacterium]
MLTLDRQLEHWIVGHRIASLNWLFEALSKAGTFGLIWVLIGFGIALVQRRPAPVLLVAAAVLLGDLESTVGKLLIPRVRPHYHPLLKVPTSHSFPSGHSSTSFAAATVIAAISPRLRIPAFVLAAGIAFSRVYNGVHWPLDVLAGSALGVLIALLLLAGARRVPRRGLQAG